MAQKMMVTPWEVDQGKRSTSNTVKELAMRFVLMEIDEELNEFFKASKTNCD